MPYWLVALPLTSKRKDASWELLQERTTGLSSNFKLDVPELRVGTLDTLMALSDDLTKTSNVMENVATKIRRQVHEFGGAAAVNGLKVEGMAVESYMQRFKWEEAKFPVRRPLKETVEKVTEVVGRIEDDLKASAQHVKRSDGLLLVGLLACLHSTCGGFYRVVNQTKYACVQVKLAEYNTLKSQVNSALRKASGSIAVRDVSAMVKPDQVVDSENLISLFVVVSKFNLKEWESTYETLSNFVVSISLCP